MAFAIIAQYCLHTLFRRFRTWPEFEFLHCALHIRYLIAWMDRWQAFTNHRLSGDLVWWQTVLGLSSLHLETPPMRFPR